MSKKHSQMHKKLALLVQLKSFTQQQLADHCEVSKITIHRFLAGKSELKVTDFIRLLNILEIDLDSFVDNRLRQEMSQKGELSPSEALALGEKIEKLDPLVRKTVLEQIDWWSQQ